MTTSDRDDPDREAILARRRRFIAIALGGITTGCVPGRPKPDNTSITTGATSGVESESSSTSGPESSSETAPQACLKYDVPPEKFDLPPETESGSDESDSGTGSTTSPRPCLVPPGP